MVETQWLYSFAGGLLVGLSALILMLFNGRIAGISGILTGALQQRQSWRWIFLLGLWAGALLAFTAGWGETPQLQTLPSWPYITIAGLLVGIGTRLSNGCTSGHGICGIGRLSHRSIVATLTFMSSAFITVFIIHHII